MSAAAETALSGLVGLVSALVPLVNAEAWALVAAARTPPVGALLLVAALAAGQTAGKLVLFEAARRGSSRFARHRTGGRAADRAARWAERVRRALATRRTAVPLVLASASAGVPPLAAVSLAAGAAGQRRWEFGVAWLVGRAVRFAALVLPTAWALGR